MLMHNRIMSKLDQRLIAAVDCTRNSWTTYAPNLDLFRAQCRRLKGAEILIHRFIRAVSRHPDNKSPVERSAHA